MGSIRSKEVTHIIREDFPKGGNPRFARFDRIGRKFLRTFLCTCLKGVTGSHSYCSFVWGKRRSDAISRSLFGIDAGINGRLGQFGNFNISGREYYWSDPNMGDLNIGLAVERKTHLSFRLLSVMQQAYYDSFPLRKLHQWPDSPFCCPVSFTSQ